MSKRFCEEDGEADWTRGGKHPGVLSYLGMIDCGWGSSIYYVMKDILQNDGNHRFDLLLIDIYKLIENNDLVPKITDTRMSTDKRNVQVNGNSLPGFCRICKKCSLPKPRWCNKITHLFVFEWKGFIFCDIE